MYSRLHSSDLANHRKRGYLFSLDSVLDIDATYVGNESRYINHSPNSNCVASSESSFVSPFPVTLISRFFFRKSGRWRTSNRHLRESEHLDFSW